ncbi:hypothetical protein Pyn_25832 [Prunus yedoensis var. nudiflora]|uniref:Uncharacterized protein n=1 Tax=Prunus yedoensis var. nudiflora TaxID=2094558 RepID=A0A314YGX6_PRUYE|nr:hypothetical protein Pyn_25832 [Prunus yedoensis var. nudiflora]
MTTLDCLCTGLQMEIRQGAWTCSARGLYKLTKRLLPKLSSHQFLSLVETHMISNLLSTR